jgi:hypothetical protein
MPCQTRVLYTPRVDGVCSQHGKICDKCIELTAQVKIAKIEGELNGRNDV